MLLSLLLACSSSPDVPPAKPDLVLVIVDTLRADHLGIYGHKRATSPTMDKLADSGTWFHRAYASSGWTLPSMATLFSGLYPHQHLVGRLAFRGTEFGKLDPSVTTVAEALQAQGYRSGAVVNNTFMAPAFAMDQGFEVYDYEGATNTKHRSAKETVDLGLGWLDRKEGPSFLVLHFMEPHLDYEASTPHLGAFSEGNPAASQIDLGGLVGKSHRNTPPTPEVQEYVRQRYDEEILHVDDAVGYLVDQLKKRSRWSNSILSITSDHGEEFWEHGGFEHGHTLMGELTRVPLIVAGGAAPERGRVDAVVEHVDLVQGLLAAAGAESPAGTSGTNLWSIADGTATDHDNTALSENILYGPPKVAIVDANARLEFDLSAKSGTVWGVDPDGIERRRLGPPDRSVVGQRLSEAITRKRGSLKPIDGVGGVTIADHEMFIQLQSLGYIEGPASPTAPEGPSEPATTP